MFKVQVRGANGYVVEFTINKHVFTLGRDPESDVFLPSQLASRNHARIFIKGGQIYVEDLQSSNGTFLRQEKLSLPTVITENDPVKLGDVYIRVSYTDENNLNEMGSGEYSVAQRLGNRKATTHLGSEETRKLRSMLNTETGAFKAVPEGPFKTKK